MKRCMSFLRRLPLVGLLLGVVALRADSAPGADAPRAAEWFTATRIDAETWGISDHGVVNCYLVVGRERALLVDTGYGHANLRAVVRALTSLPLIVVNTHGHRDHSGGDVQFGAVLAHRADFPVIERNATPEQRQRNRETLGTTVVPEAEQFDYARDAQPLALQAIRDGERIDLGGRVLEVIETPGHTPGEIVLLDRAHKLLFAGDHINRLVWLQLAGCLPLETYLASLEKVAARGDEFATILPGHHEPIDRAYLQELIACVRAILDGSAVDEPYRYGQTEGRIAHHARASVVFDPRNLRAGH